MNYNKLIHGCINFHKKENLIRTATLQEEIKIVNKNRITNETIVL